MVTAEAKTHRINVVSFGDDYYLLFFFLCNSLIKKTRFSARVVHLDQIWRFQIRKELIKRLIICFQKIEIKIRGFIQVDSSYGEPKFIWFKKIIFARQKVGSKNKYDMHVTYMICCNKLYIWVTFVFEWNLKSKCYRRRTKLSRSGVPLRSSCSNERYLDRVI